MRHVLIMIAAIAAWGMIVSTGDAVALCGDANDNGAVTVSDGVAALRVAAGLPGECPPAACDVDRDGDVTVTDGVNVLRLAAGLDVARSCRDLTFSRATLDLINDRVEADGEGFFVYRDADDGLNKGFPSGFFGQPTGIQPTIDAACLFDPNESGGCGRDENRVDTVRGTVLRVSLPQLGTGAFVGLSFVEPEHLFLGIAGHGYDLSGATQVEFEAAALTDAAVQFGVAGCVTPFETIPGNGSFTHRTLRLADLTTPPGTSIQCPPANLMNVTILFTVVSNDQHAPHGATIFLDDIRFTPTPPAQRAVASFPIGTQTFGSRTYDAIPFASDQVLRNLTTIYESAIAMQALAIRLDPRDREGLGRVANAFDYALHHDNQGLSIPPAPDGAHGLHSGYASGDLPLKNDQNATVAAGQVRLAGFSASLCPSHFCLVLDGATGGNNAFAILALLEAYDRLGNATYLTDALEIGRWIVGRLQDTDPTRFGGYFLGFPDEGRTNGPDSRQTGKSVENNADIFTALLALADHDPANADDWRAHAKHAGDFVLAMFDADTGRFNAGTVPVDIAPTPGISLDGPRRGDERINTFDFLDSQSFTTLAMAESSAYRDAIDWRRPIRHAVERFAETAVTGDRFEGFNISVDSGARRRGVAWEFTGQMVVAMRLVDREFGAPDLAMLAAHYVDEIRRAQADAPFGDGRGLVAATIDGSPARALDQCLDTPFQCIPARVGLAASAWAVFADADVNPLRPSE